MFVKLAGQEKFNSKRQAFVAPKGFLMVEMNCLVLLIRQRGQRGGQVVANGLIGSRGEGGGLLANVVEIESTDAGTRKQDSRQHKA